MMNTKTNNDKQRGNKKKTTATPSTAHNKNPEKTLKKNIKRNKRRRT